MSGLFFFFNEASSQNNICAGDCQPMSWHSHFMHLMLTFYAHILNYGQFIHFKPTYYVLGMWEEDV